MYIGKCKITWDKYPVWFKLGFACNWKYKYFIFEMGFYQLTIWYRG